LYARPETHDFCITKNTRQGFTIQGAKMTENEPFGLNDDHA
jgi:hypothetical protein